MFEFVVSENVGQNSDESISKGDSYSNTPHTEKKRQVNVFSLHAMKAYREVEV